MSTESPAVRVDQPALFGTADVTQLTDVEFRVAVSRATSWLKVTMKNTSVVVGIVLAESSRRWGDHSLSYKSMYEVCRNLTGVSDGTLARWKRNQQVKAPLPSKMKGSISSNAGRSSTTNTADAIEPESSVESRPEAVPHLTATGAGSTAPRPGLARACNTDEQSPAPSVASTGVRHAPEGDTAGSTIDESARAVVPPSAAGPSSSDVPGGHGAAREVQTGRSLPVETAARCSVVDDLLNRVAQLDPAELAGADQHLVSVAWGRLNAELERRLRSVRNGHREVEPIPKPTPEAEEVRDLVEDEAWWSA